jgi:hypothetical protein
MTPGSSRNDRRRSSGRWRSQPVRPRSVWKHLPASRSRPSSNPVKTPRPSRERPNAAPRSLVGPQRGAGGESATGVSLLWALRTVARLVWRAPVEPNRPDAQRGRTVVRASTKARCVRTASSSNAVASSGSRDWASSAELMPPFDPCRPIADPLRRTDDGGNTRHNIPTRWQRRAARAFDADRAALSLQPQVRRQEGIG